MDWMLGSLITWLFESNLWNVNTWLSCYTPAHPADEAPHLLQWRPWLCHQRWTPDVEGRGVRVCQSCKHKWVLHYSPATTRYSHLLMTRISVQSLVSRHELRINHSFFCRYLSSVCDVIGTVVRKYKYFFRQGHLIFSEGSWGVCWKAGTDLDIELYWLSSRASSWSGVSWAELGLG